MSTSGEITLTICFTILVFPGLLGNILVCLVVFSHRTMQTPINYLFVNLAVADIITLTFIGPQYIFIHFFKHPTGTTGDFLCKFITGGNISWIGGVASVFSLVTISFERYNAVINPYSQASNFSTTKVKVIIVCCWIFTLAFNFPLFFVIYYNRDKKFCLESWPSVTSGKINSTFWLVVVGIIPAIIMTSLYSRVVCNLWFKKTNEFVQIVVRRSRKKVTKVALIVSVIYVISWFPQLVVYLLSNYETGIKFGEFAYMASVVMVTFNSAVNPLIYALQSGRFRQHFKELLCRHQRRRRVFPLEYCDAAAVLSLQNTKPKNESHMLNKETAQTNRETAEEKNNLARDSFRVQLTENTNSCKKSVI